MNYKLFLVLFCSIIFLSEQSSSNSDNLDERLVIYLPYLGRIEGERLQNFWNNGTIYQFNAIRYGRAERFRPPTDEKPWPELLDATSYAHPCPRIQEIVQAYNATYPDWEDCLFLTIRSTNLKASFPVMVYLATDDLLVVDQRDTSYLLERDVILVAIQHRSDIFGILSNQTPEMPGNAGLYDAIKALEWIQKWIKYFGGDSNRVTLFGQGEGSVIAHLLTMSKAVPPDLFHRVIYHSKTALSPYIVQQNPKMYRETVAELVNCTNSNLAEVQECLKNVDLIDLLEAHIELKMNHSESVVGSFILNDTLLPDMPDKLLSEMKFRAYPTMGGVVKNSGTYFGNDVLPKIQLENGSNVPGEQLIQKMLHGNYLKESHQHWFQYAIQNLFTPEQLAKGTVDEMLPGLIDLVSIVESKKPILEALQANARLLPNDTYLFTFNYNGPYHVQNMIDDIPFGPGVTLYDDSVYLFPLSEELGKFNDDERRIVRIMADLWTSFATDGVPKSLELTSTSWPSMTQNNGPYLIIDKVMGIGTDFRDEFKATIRDGGANVVKKKNG